MGKNLAKYETIRKETNIYKQKTVNIDDCNEFEEVEVKQQVEKQKEKRHMITIKKQTVKKKQKTEENEMREEAMW